MRLLGQRLRSTFILNTVVAEELSLIAEKLEKATDPGETAVEIVREIIKAHKRVIFNGNNYSEDWVKEAATRGLPNISNTVLAIGVLKDEKNISVLEKNNVLSRVEVESRYEILLENYSKTINIEALTLVDIVNRQLLPAALTFAGKLASLRAAGVSSTAAEGLLGKVTKLADTMADRTAELKAAADAAGEIECPLASATAFREKVVPGMAEVRSAIDALEPIVPANIWPVPVYADLLFRV